MQTLREEQGPPLPLSSLRLFIPPLRLVCAALWQVIERRDIMDYGLLEEFATTVLEIVPELMSYRERVQLLLGLRARLVLELCRCDDELCRPDTVQPHLNRMRSCVSNHKGEVSDPNVEASEASFTKLIETLMEEPKERELFFQNVFPEEFGPKYDSTLQILVWEFLSRLEKLLPTPNIKQTASWLNLAPALLEECMQSVAHPEPLQALLHHHKNGKQLDTNALRSTGGDYILSSLSSPSSVKEESASYQAGPERQSYPTMQGYQSPFPCDEPEMSWDCRMADCRVWTVKPPAGSASVEVETIDDATDIMVKRKTIVKESIKETRREEAVLCPQTRSGLKTSRLTAACLRRQPVLRLNRLDMNNMPFPKSLLTLILRRGRLQAEATRRPGPKRRGRKKKRRRGRGVANEQIEIDTLDVSDTPPPKSSLTLTLKRGIVQAEATSSQVPKKRGRKKGQKMGPGITRLKIEKVGVHTLDISDMSLPKTSLKLIIRRGKLQAEAMDRKDGQKRRGRKKKWRRGRGVRNEKTEAKGVKRERSPETEEDAEPSDNELWTTVNKGATVDESGGVRPSPHCPSSHKREEELQQPIQNFHSEEHSGHMAKGQNREERSESVPQDSLTPEPSNSSHKRSFRSEQHRGHMAEGQNRKERSESVPQDSQTPEPSNSSHKRSQRSEEHRGHMAEGQNRKERSESVPQDSQTPEPSNSSHKRSQRSEEHRGHMTEGKNRKERSESVPQDSQTPEPSNSSHKRSQRSEEQRGHMAEGQNRKERSESVPQDTQTPEPSNSSHKRSQRSEEQRGHMAEGQNRKERSESVPQDSQTPEPSNSSHKRSQRSEEQRGHMAEGKNRKERSESVPQDSQTPEPSNSSHKRSQRVKACSFCGKTFTDTLGLTRHMRSHIEQMSHQCTQCGQDFEFSEDLEEHQNHGCEMNKKDNSEENGDDYCGRTVQQKSDLKKKPDLKRDKKPDLKGGKKPDLKGGKKTDLKGDKKPDLKGDKKPDLKGDKKPDLKGDKKPDLKGDKKPDLEGDKKPDLEGDKKPDLEGDKKPDLKGDKKSDLEGDKKPDLKGDKKPDLEGDKKPDQEGDKKTDLKGDTQDCSIKCHVCGKITTRMLGLRRHLLIHFNNGAYKCSACPKTFISNADLRSHLRSKRSCREKCSDEVITTGLHLKSVPGEYKCPYCGDTFQLPDDLRGHTKDCSRKCHVCGKTTARMLDMRRHMLKHNNNGPYKCPVCPRTFISHTDLKMHLKTKKLCREKCSDVMMNELLSSADGKCRENVNEAGVMSRCQQPSSNNTARPLKSIEEFFEEFSHDLQQSDNSISSEVNLNSLNSLDEDYSDEISQYQPMKDVDLNCLHEDSIMTTEDYSDEISQYPPVKDVDLNTLHEDYSQAEISQYQPVKDVDPVEDRRSVDDSGGNEMANDKEPNSTECLTEVQVSHTEACPLQDSQSETSGEVKNEIQRGKLQAEATGSQGQKRRGRKRKERRGRGVRNEKTEAKGVKREHSPETEEDAEPSYKELWTSVNERTTVNDSGGVRPSPQCPSSHKNEEEFQQPIQNFHSEEHRGHMAEGQNRKERSESVPQDSQTPEPSNSSHKRSQRVKACSFCGKTFTDTLGLTRHMRSHIEQMSHQCTQCGQDFEFSEDLEEHQKSSCEEKKTEDGGNNNENGEDNGDDYCGESVQQKTELKKNSDLQGDLKQHVKGDTQDCSIKCHVCGKITTRMLGLRRHLLIHFNNGAYKCSACPKTFISNADLRSHLRSKRSCREKCSDEVITTGLHLKSVPGEYKCPYCGDTFQLPDDLRGHTKDCSRKCHVCGKTTAQMLDMRRHMLKHNNNGPYKCPVCPRTFISHTDLKMHLKIKILCRQKCSDVMAKELLSSVDGRSSRFFHETGVMTRCQQPSSSNTGGPSTIGPVLGLKSFEEFFEELSHDSDISMSSDVNLNSLHEDYSQEVSQYQPMKEINQSNPGEYKCPHCGDTFQFPHDLKGHTKDCSRKCHVCGKTTLKTCDMRRHMLKHYDGPIKCPVCPKSFMFHTDLKKHLKTKRLCREKCSDVLVKELLSTVDGRCRKNVSETGVMARCQQSNSLKSYEELFEELPRDSDKSMSSGVNLYSLHEDYSDEISQYQPMKDVDLNSLREDYCDEISQCQHIKDIDADEDDKSLEDSGGNEMPNCHTLDERGCD
ncbi:zinc finger protein 208-like [Oncorhynchus clarkii lewisi]|uniref:zinc finger protein 208-like n=1 Tax=Oncorhynchus clarkii lewisi TaxID=490388 RepID=UPI0039B881FA